jgi:hypothetical protein
MRVDGMSFLLAALGMYACHSEHKRRELQHPSPPAPAPEPIPVVDASDVPAVVEAGAPEAAVTRLAEDAGSDAPPAPVPSLAELQRKCRALAPTSPDCGGDVRKRMCQTVLTEFDRPAAARAIECYAKLDATMCDTCGVRICTQDALVGLPRRTIAGCAGVEKKATETSDESYGKLMLEICESYAAGMTKQGQTRFIRCLTQNMGMGVRICLWDPSATPCTEA